MLAAIAGWLPVEALAVLVPVPDTKLMQRAVRRGMSFRKIGIVIAREDGREMPYTASGVGPDPLLELS